MLSVWRKEFHFATTLAHSLGHVGSADEVLLYIDQNFSSINDKINTELNIWSLSAFLLLGKLFVLRSIIVPKIMLKSAKLPMILPDSCIKNIYQVLFKFIWESKRENVAWWQLCCDIVDGKAKMIDIKQHMLRLQFKAVVKLFDQNYTAAWETSEILCIDENLFFLYLAL